jgi:putative membrane protein
MSALFAFLHHLAAFALVSALVVEWVLIRNELTLWSMRLLRHVDALIGLCATAILIVGFLRVFYFEKGAYFYFHNHAFFAKIALFVVVALLSIYPTITFAAWGPALKAGRLPVLEPRRLGVIRTLIHCELAGVVLLILCAALMARGIGFINV